MSVDFIGSGWAIPVHTDATGSIVLATGDREIAESIQLILSTAKGERPMRPEFGCGVHDYVFAGSDPATMARIAYEVRASLERWEPRIEVDDVIVTQGDDASTLHIDVRYTVSDTNDPRNLVFPFYVIPDD